MPFWKKIYGVHKYALISAPFFAIEFPPSVALGNCTTAKPKVRVRLRPHTHTHTHTHRERERERLVTRSMYSSTHSTAIRRTKVPRVLPFLLRLDKSKM